MNGRYEVKARAGWSRTRHDGSQYSAETDTTAEAAERWFADCYGGRFEGEGAYLGGDAGYDVLMNRRGHTLRVDVIHAGFTDDGIPRRGNESHLIVNLDSNKLTASDVLVLVEGPPFVAVGCIYTARFLAIADLRDHGFGLKFSLHARRLLPVDALLGRR
jgi:hypothetical protein